MKQAMLYKNLDNNKVQCNVCSHNCIIENNKRGFCGVRENKDGKLYSLVYGKVVAKNIDPIEKKPLFHFLPGSLSYSIATVGCNMRCMHCQNFDISQIPQNETGIPGEQMTAEQIVENAISANCQSIAYTYTEPTIYLEFALDCMKIAHEKGLKNIWVSNGYMTEQTLEEIKPYLDAINIDLKFFDNKKYIEICGTKLDPILSSIKWLYNNNVWLELTTLVIPGQNDGDKQLQGIADFIVNQVSDTVPWHVSAFYPTYKLTNSFATPIETIVKAYQIGKKAGLKYIYAGNVPEQGIEDTYCPKCLKKVIERSGYDIRRLYSDDGKCLNCNNQIHLIL